MNWINLFTSFEGRINRQPFWIAIVVLAVIEGIAALVNQQIDNDRIGAVIDLVILYPEFAVAAKRGHDRNISTWVVGIFFALGAVFDLLLLTGVLKTANVEDSSNLIFIIFIPLGLFALVLFVDLGFRRGTRGANRFGPDPLDATPAR